MKSALCLLSGKSCARLIEMFIRQIYRDETEEGREGGQAAPRDQRRQGAAQGGFGLAQKEREQGLAQVGGVAAERKRARF